MQFILVRMSVDSLAGKKFGVVNQFQRSWQMKIYVWYCIRKTYVVDGIQVKSYDINKQILMIQHYFAIISHELFCTVPQEKCRKSGN